MIYPVPPNGQGAAAVILTSLAGTELVFVDNFGALLAQTTTQTIANLAESNLGFINVKAAPYNAKGDGVTNDTAAIQAALTAAGISGGLVWFPPSRYLTELLTTASNTQLLGAGTGISVLISRSGGTILTNATSAAGSIKISGFSLYGQHYLVSGSATGTGIAFTGADNTHRPSGLTFADLDMRGFATAISNRLCANTWYRDLFITLCSAGIKSDTCADSNLRDIEVQNDPLRADNTGYAFTFSNDRTHGASDEGVRASGLSSNGQFGGLLVQNQDFGDCVNFSFTTGLTNMVVFQGATQWSMSVGEIDPAAAFASLTTTVGTASQPTSNCIFTNIRMSGGTFGAVLAGTYLTMGGCNFEANSNADIDLAATAHGCGISGGACLSVGVGTSVVEAAGGDYNQVTGVRVIGTVSISGAHTSATNNMVVT